MKQIDCVLLDPRLGDSIPLPSYASAGAAGIDLRACIDAPLCLDANKTAMIPTGIAIHLADRQHAALILPRSGLGHKHGLVLSNLVGLIDSDYQGELKIPCWNRADQPYTIDIGERIAQLVVIVIAQAPLNVVSAFAASERGEGGFGSTGST